MKPLSIPGRIIKDEYRSLLILLIVFIQFYIRNGNVNIPEMREGMAVSWLLYGICIATFSRTYVIGAGLFFTTAMLYVYADNHLMDNKDFAAIDLFLVLSVIVTWSIWCAMEYFITKVKPDKVEIRTMIIIVCLATLLLLGINYGQYYPGLFSFMHWDFNLKGGPFYKSDAFAHTIAALLFIYNSKRLGIITGCYYLAMAGYNYIDEMYFDPTEQSAAEWLVIITIHIFFLYLTRWYLKRYALPFYRGHSVQ